MQIMMRLRTIFLVVFMLGMLIGIPMRASGHHFAGLTLFFGFFGLWGFVFTEAFGFKKGKRSRFQTWGARIFLILLTIMIFDATIQLATGLRNVPVT